jgi:hypothetical protein
MEIDHNVAAVNPAEFLKPLPPRCDPRGLHRIAFLEHEQSADPPHPVRLLRAPRAATPLRSRGPR